MTAPQSPAIIRNPTKVDDPETFAAGVESGFADRGLPTPRWLDTTADDPGVGQTKQALADGADLIVAAGGDGTVRACASVLAGTEVPLGLLPVGTGNLLARNLDVPRSLDEALDLVAGDARRRIDVAELDGELFTVMAGAGFDAQLFEFTSDRLKTRIGWGAYVLAGAKAVRSVEPMQIKLLLDGSLTQTEGVGLLVGNVGTLTGGLTVLPDAQPDDGMLDVAVLKPTTSMNWIALGARVIIGKRPQPWYLERFRAAVVEVEFSGEPPVEIDGDLLPARGRFLVKVAPRALIVCALPGAGSSGEA